LLVCRTAIALGFLNTLLPYEEESNEFPSAPMSYMKLSQPKISGT
jgi:hypothetical protein